MTFLIRLIARFVGLQYAKPVAYALLVFLVLIPLVFMVGRCTADNDDVTQQVEQTERSTDAIANAAENAIERVQGQAIKEADIDAATIEAAREIGNAQSVDDIRNHVRDSMCRYASARNDPACIVR